MMKHWNSFVRKASPLLAGAMLLQAGGCGVDTGGLFAGWATAIANELITGFVYRNFNLTS